METKTLYIPNMSCEHCVRTIKNELSDLPGVRDIDISLDDKHVRITCDSGDKWEEVTTMLTEIKYPPQ